MNLYTEPRSRCSECGGEHPHMVRMERGGPYCMTCLLHAAELIEVTTPEAKDSGRCPYCRAEGLGARQDLPPHKIVPVREIDREAAIWYFTHGDYVEYRNHPDYKGLPIEWTAVTRDILAKPAVGYQFRLCLLAEDLR